MATRGRIHLGLLTGDGIGPEIVGATTEIVLAACDRAGAGDVEWEPLPVGWEGIERGEGPLPADTVDALKACDGWLLGPVDFAAYPAAYRSGRNPSGELRHSFDLYANVRPARSFAGIPSVARDVDLVIVRENTEGFYADRNMLIGSGDLRVTDDVAIVVGVFTRSATERVTHVACKLALERKRHVTIVHKANVLPNSMGLFLETARRVAAEYDVVCDDFHADAMAAQVIRRPHAFDVIVCENFIGDVFSDLTTELTGSLGLAGSLNAGNENAMAQAAHGAAPDIAGRNIANPVGEILSAKMLIEWLGERRGEDALLTAANSIDQAIADTFADGIATVDIGGEASTSEFATEVVARLRVSATSGEMPSQNLA
jgi:3-isopropylmalate dehydrogenase